MPKLSENYEAILLDLDGVITRTAKVHGRAWKEMFDEYLRKRAQRESEEFRPFDIEGDYLTYVDGKPRYEGVRSFLESRGIELPYGEPSDAPNEETVCGLGNRKNERFQELVHEMGVEVFDDAVQQIQQWRADGLKTAVISSSKNCKPVLEAAKLEHLFDQRVDGVLAAELGLTGKPSPDIFQEAAKRLDVDAIRCVVIEDAESGVEAGRAGDFGMVVGVARGEKDPNALRRHGADMVVRKLTELSECAAANPGEKPAAMESLDEIAERLGDVPPTVFLDYDGTLSPIVPRPEDAVLSPEMKQALAELAEVCRVTLVSGRDRADVKHFVELEQLYYAGSHGFDITGPGGMNMQLPEGQAALGDLDEAQKQLEERLADIEGSQVERKKYAIAIHYRNAPEAALPQIESYVDEVHADHPNLRKRGGKKIFELQPDVEWHKGKAVLWLMDSLGMEGSVPLYVGDDVTDEDAFAALKGKGLGLRVGRPDEPTEADYVLDDVPQVGDFLRWLKEQAVKK